MLYLAIYWRMVIMGLRLVKKSMAIYRIYNREGGGILRTPGQRSNAALPRSSVVTGDLGFRPTTRK
ncbi:conserved hypothetical protein [Ricinus communis]|uniref:Uncharacterized protein n=1 Tax=Ricinus communis TaxID=3988 RepID=B9SIE2_RICCO|nr:conserved hypothetical protein [Ricinus communis]